MTLDVDAIRSQFPSLKTIVNGHPVVYFDGPGGTQVPQRVIDRMVRYLTSQNSNTHGTFLTTRETDEVLVDTRRAFADYFGCAWEEVAFDNNSTTISFKLSQAIVRDLKPGDEVVITDIDHEANRGPWELLAERGIVVKSVKVNTATCTLDLDDYAKKLSKKTKVVAFNCASNAVGTISDAKTIVGMAHEAGALTIADAVHLALHAVIDVRDLDTDFLFCSAYKFFGPHIGVLYGKKERMEALKTLRVGAQDKTSPVKFETGTLNHEGIAGAAEAIEFIADIGRKFPGTHGHDTTGRGERRKSIIAGMMALEDYEKPLANYFKDELAKIDGLTLYGPPRNHPCTSTISFRMKGHSPESVATRLGNKGIFVWDGNFYAVRLVESLGLNDTGGLIRIGLAPYNTREEIDRALEEIKAIAAGIPA